MPLVLRPRHRSLRSGVGGTSGGGGGGGIDASLSGQAASFSAGRLRYTHPAILAGQILAASSGALTKELSDSLVSEDSAFQTGDFATFEIGEVLAGSAAAFSSGVLSKVRSDALTGKAITLTSGTLVYNAPPPVVSVLLNGKGMLVSAGALTTTAGKSSSLTGKAAAFSGGTVQIVRSDALTGQAAAFTTGVASTGLYNVQATSDGSDVTITATSTIDLSYPAKYGVEFGDGSGGVYQFAVSEPGQVSSQSITIGQPDGVVPGHVLSYRPYYNLDQNDPISSRMYGAAGEILVATPGTLVGKAITSSTGALKVVRSDVLFGSASSTVQFSPGTLVFVPGGSSTAEIVGQAATFSKGTFKVTRTRAMVGQAADFAPGPNFASEFEGLLLGQG